MARYMTKQEYKAWRDRMAKTIVDFATDMTALDLYEYQHPHEEIILV